MTIEANNRAIFISHTEADRAIAEAIKDAVETLFGPQAVAIAYSSSRELGSGVRFGEDWFQWIGHQVRTATVTLVLLTPVSVQKPWVLWEAGAVYGAALTDPSGALRRVRPIAFQVAMSDVPSPLQSSHAHIARGDNYSDVKLLLNEFVEEFSTSNSAAIRAAQNVPEATERWLVTVAEALRTAPLSPTEPVVNEWCTRLDDLSASNRSSEVRQVHEWLLVAFGQERGADQPIDIRIHRRLAQLYLSGRNYVEAAAQFNLARRISPRDLFVLRSLGQAYLSYQDYAAAGQIIDDISRLDSDAFIQNPECAALKGRWLREQNRIAEAQKVYAEALDANPQSYYLADLLGMSALQLDQVPAAAEAYRRALAIIDTVAERNIWVNATAATAAIVSGDPSKAASYLAAIRAAKPTDAEIDSIQGGLIRLQHPLQIPATQIAEWTRILRDDG